MYTNLLIIALIYIALICMGVYLANKKPSYKWTEKAKRKYEIHKRKNEEKERKLHEQAQLELIKKQKYEEGIYNQELTRTNKELYSIKEFPGYHVILPYLASILSFLVGFYFFLILKDKEIGTYLLIPGILAGVIHAYFESLKKDWEFVLNCKKKIYEENKDYAFYNGYSFDRIYTDSSSVATIYDLINALLWVSNIIIIIGLIGLILFWVSTIHISSVEFLAAIFAVILYIKEKEQNKKIDKLSSKIEALTEELEEIRERHEEIEFEYD